MDESQAWLVGGASVIGAAHVRRGAPNEDAFHHQAENGRFLIAVADGHGGAAYFRSDVGAQLAVQALATTLEWFFDDPEQPDQLATDVTKLWRQLVQDHLQANPLGLHELPDSSPYLAYGSTLVAIAGTQSWLLALQIGDGDLMLGFPDGTLERPLGDDTDVVGEQTYSLCLEQAAAYFRSAFRRRLEGDAWPDFALVATDGVSKSFVDDGAFNKVVLSYRDLVSTNTELTQTLDALPDWLREVSDNGSGDDATLCIATRRPMS